jgi:assimilatory nitrate reductase catalytic subunit
VLCACFSIGVNTISEAVRSRHLTSVEQIGAVLKAGTNCGSCVPELQALLAGQR